VARDRLLAMYPYIHLGPLELGTFGIFMWLAFLAAYFALNADFRRRDLRADPHLVISVIALAGLAGAKLWHLLESPSEFFAAPFSMFFSRTGFAWFGGFIAGILTLIYFARRYRIPLLTMMDACAPATAIGYAVGRIGCLISGDGDYGKPTSLPWGMSFPNGIVPTPPVCQEYGWPANCAVHPTPIYEFVVGVAIFYYLWRLGARDRNASARPGLIVAQFFVFSGVARFLVEFIRINPRSILGMSNAQAVSLLSIVAGIVLLLTLKRESPAVGAA
jgi:phosphatidylglycerol---prolipoprotein diacylglyceryl transferase